MLTSIIVAICLCCKRRPLFSHLVNAMVFLMGFALMMYVAAFNSYYSIRYYYSYNPYYGYYYIMYLSGFIGNYYVVQFFALLWGVQMLTPYWLGLKLCLVNHKSSRLPFIKSKTMALVSIIGVPVAISFIYLLFMIIMMAIS